MGKLICRAWPVLLLSALILGCAARWPESGLLTATSVSRSPAIEDDGKPLNLADYKGKVVLLSFWYSGCRPCRALFPHEKELVERFRGTRFVLLGINTADDPVLMRKTQTSAGLTWRSFCDAPNGAISARFKVEGVPTLVLLDGTGKERWRHLGAPPPGTLETAIGGLLAETK